MLRCLRDQKETIESLGNNLTLLIEAHDSELKSLKQKVAVLKTKLGECQTCSKDTTDLERKLSEVFKKEFDNFVTNLNEGS
jgi:hypothetical protein